MSEKIHTDGVVAQVRKDKKAFKIGANWFSNYNPMEVKVGDHVEFDYAVKGDFKNIAADSLKWLSNAPKDITNQYKEFIEMANAIKLPEINGKDRVPQEVWERKDRLYHRSQCLAQAVALVVASDTKDPTVALQIAEMFEEWVFR